MAQTWRQSRTSEAAIQDVRIGNAVAPDPTVIGSAGTDPNWD